MLEALAKEIGESLGGLFHPMNFSSQLLPGFIVFVGNISSDATLRFYLMPPKQLALAKGDAVPNYLATHGIAAEPFWSFFQFRCVEFFGLS